MYIVELPLVRGKLTVRVHVPLAAQQDQLLLGERGVDVREGDGVERQVPRRVPRIFPLVRHRDDVVVVEVSPTRVATGQSSGIRRRLTGVAVEPTRNVVVV